MEIHPGETLHAKASEALRHARALPIGPCRNELRQIAICLRWIERKGEAGVQSRALEILRAGNDPLSGRERDAQ